ncbi:MAG: polyphosphate polymerase domain-containing protein [Oscillospiraceae bacterium]|nr:polyphosphate polymerase domain-containing protein [Oscillospiraceae bacterium]
MFTKFLHNVPSGIRHEFKYAINSGVYEILRRRCASVMKRDKFSTDDGGYRVTSLYFDDVYGTAYNDKLTGILSRKKFRIRAYNLSPDRINLEVKLKEGSYIKKKSAVLTYDEYKAIIGGELFPSLEGCRGAAGWSSGVLQDFRSQKLKPAVITDYYREAFTADAGNVRITFDKNLQTGFGTADMFNASYSPVDRFYNQAVLEIKYDRFLPTYIQELFSGFPLMSEPVSKYILCANYVLEVNKKCL